MNARGRALLACWLLLLSSLVHAQEPGEDESRKPMHFSLGDLRRQYGAAQKRRNIGLVLAVPGVAMLVIGSVVIGYGAQEPNFLSGATRIASGAVVDTVGLAFTIPGLVLWIQGQERMDKYTWRWRQEGQDGFPR